MYPLILTIQILALCISFIVILVVILRKPFHGQTVFLLLSATVIIQCFGYLQELTSNSLEAAILAIRTQYFGSCFVNVTFLYFLFDYCNYKKNKSLFSFLLILNIIILIAVSTCEYHSLYYTSFEFTKEGIFPHIILGKGPIYKLFKLEVAVTNIIILITLLRHYFSLNKSKRHQELNFTLACLFPSITCLLYGFGMFEVYDPSSSSFVIAGAFLLVAIYRHQLFDVIHTARDSVIEAMEEALIVVDAHYCLLDYNPSAQKLFPELFHCVKEAQLKTISSFLEDMFQDKVPTEFNKDGRYYRSQISKIYNNLNLVGYSAWIFDFTDSRNSMENLIQLREQAENANQAKSLFLANMSHEIRTPLNTILGLTDIIINKDINYQVRSDIINIKTAGNTLLSIINDILDLSKIESGKMNFVNEEYKLASVLQDVIGIISVKLTQKPIILKVMADKNLPKYLIGDELRLRQILINLLSNAVKFTEQGSICLIINASYPIEDQQNIAVLQFQIKDTGRGIAPNDQRRIFELFEQVGTNPSHPMEGSGLGLTICQRLLSMIGGTICVESELGMGSTFTVTLPQVLSKINPEDSTVVSAKQDTSSDNITGIAPYHYTALVVDDNPLNLMVAKGLLNLFEMDVTTVETSLTAIDMLNHHSYDIIFLDYMMPEMDGIETLHAIRALDPPYCKTIPIIALTANVVNGVDKLLIKEGFNDFLSKPIDQKKLGGLLSKWLRIQTEEYLHEDKSKLLKLQLEAFQQFSKFYHIDWNTGLTNCANQWQSYFETLVLFANDGIRQIEQLDQAFKDKDYSLYTVWIHALKSSLLTIGAIQIAEQALTLELAAKENNIDYVLDNHMSFLCKCSFLCRAIEGFLSAKDYAIY